jgi:hypothetical protein
VTKDLAESAIDERSLVAEVAVDKGRGIDESADEDAVHGDVGERAKGAAFIAVRGDRGQEVLDLPSPECQVRRARAIRTVKSGGVNGSMPSSDSESDEAELETERSGFGGATAIRWRRPSMANLGGTEGGRYGECLGGDLPCECWLDWSTERIRWAAKERSLGERRPAARFPARRSRPARGLYDALARIA